MEPLSVLGYSSFRCCRPRIMQTLASQGIQFFESPFVPTLLSQSSSPSSSSFLAPDYILRNVFPHPLFSTATPEMSFEESTLWEICADYSLPSRLLIFCGNGSSRKADTVSLFSTVTPECGRVVPACTMYSMTIGRTMPVLVESSIHRREQNRPFSFIPIVLLIYGFVIQQPTGSRNLCCMLLKFQGSVSFTRQYMHYCQFTYTISLL